jgi:diguanylate cyclase (GGDEF)-like protein/PAS domain S-box-containing protein
MNSTDTGKNDCPLDHHGLHEAVFDVLPSPTFIKDIDLQYVFVNVAFEELFSISRESIIGKGDRDFFKKKQAAQCRNGDIVVMESGETNESIDIIYNKDGTKTEMFTRKSRLTTPKGETFLIGIMHNMSESNSAVCELREKQQYLKKQAAERARMALIDSLTGCCNRQAFTQRTPTAFAKAGNKGSLLMMDIDFFKKINHSYGYEMGDAMLIHFVKIVKRCLRSKDNLARLGGEAFAVTLPGASMEDSRMMAERIRLKVASTPMKYKSKQIYFTVSIGLVEINQQEKINVHNLLHQGDNYLYKAKRGGRNRVTYKNINAEKSKALTTFQFT